MSADQLQAALDAVDARTAPDEWALAAYRLAVARAELATQPAELAHAVALLDRAGAILTAQRAPLEHARILVATGSCRRLGGDPAAAARLFERALELQEGRADVAERAASMVDLGLARIESGSPAAGLRVLDEALAVVGEETAEDRRLRGAALVNRAQARQQLGGHDQLQRAAADYRGALRCFDETGPQQGLALHGLGAVLLALGDAVDEAIERFTASIRVLTASAFPFQHAVARHSLAVAYERRSGPDDLARALAHVEAAIAMFDPRLHRGPWQTAADTMARLAHALGRDTSPEDRAVVFVGLVERSPDHERATLLRDRLGRLGTRAAVSRARELQALFGAAARSADGFERLVRAAIPVLMELPDELLADACRSVVDAIDARDDAEVLAARLDDAVHDLLFGPQRVRVRDLLTDAGWRRP